jgi:hypothetical protein
MKLHRVTITFNRVFDVVRFRGYEKPPHTLFGFETSFGKYHGVEISGHPRIEAGDTVTALLSNPNNWQTLKGWVNHKTREIAAPVAGASGITSAAMFITAGVCLYLTWLTLSSFLAVPFFIGGVYWLRYAIAASEIRKALQQHGA